LTQTTDNYVDMERLHGCHGALQTDKLQDSTGRQEPEFERTEGTSASATELRFSHHHHHHQQQQQIGYDDQERPQQDQHCPAQPEYRCSGQQQMTVDTIPTGGPPPAAQSHYHHHYHRHHPSQQHQQHQGLLQGHHYFINDLLSATAASSSICAPDLAIASSMQLLNGKSKILHFIHGQHGLTFLFFYNTVASQQ